jgi:hypothetical protein
MERPLFVRTLACTFAAASIAAPAYQLDYSLEASLGHSDNINQSEIDPTAQSLLIPRLKFDYREDGAYLLAHANGQVEYRDYLGGAFSNEFRGQFAGVATWFIFPQRLSFDFEDYAGVEPVNIFAPNAPNNTQQVNVATVGPTFNFRIQQTLKGQAELRLTSNTASKSKEFNSRRGFAALRAVKELSPLKKVSGNVEGQHVHFTDRSGGPDYNRYDAYARYQNTLSQLDIDVALGGSRVNFANARGNHSGWLGRGSLSWRATPNHTLAVSALRQYSDASQDLIADPAALLAVNSLGNGIAPGTTPITSQVYLEKRVGASYVYHTERFLVRAEPYYKTLNYLLDPGFNQDVHGVVAGFSYRPRPLWTIALDAMEETRDYTNIARRDEDMRFDLSFADRLTRQWSVRLDLVRNQRNSDTVGQSFRENAAYVTAIFTR